MSLDFSILVTRYTSYDNCENFIVEDDYPIFSVNITHNLVPMAKVCGVYKTLWRGEELNYANAYQLIDDLKKGIEFMKDNEEQARSFNPPNGWGCYEGLLESCKDILKACEEYPHAKLSVWR